MVAVSDRTPKQPRRNTTNLGANLVLGRSAAPRVLMSDSLPLSPASITTKITLLSQHKQERTVALGAINAFLNEPAAAFYGVQMTDAGDLWALVEHLAEAIHRIDPDFRPPHLSGSVHAILDSDAATRVGEQLGAAIGKSRVRTLVLDELDRLWDEQAIVDSQNVPVDIAGLANTLLVALAERLPQDFRLIICARSLDFKPWQTLISQGAARPVFSPPDPLLPRLDVYAFGVGTVYADNARISTWDGLLPQAIFFFFMDKPLLTRDEIFQAFWPEMTARDATNVFHVIKRKIAERVNYDPIIYSMGRYHRSPKIDIYFDVAEFETCVSRFHDNPDDIESMERAVQLRRAPFLHGYTQPWAVERRSQLDAKLVDVLVGLDRHYREIDPLRALGYLQRAVQIGRTREDINRRVIQRYAELGQVENAIDQYKRLESYLHGAFNITPDRATRELYQKISANNSNR